MQKPSIEPPKSPAKLKSLFLLVFFTVCVIAITAAIIEITGFGYYRNVLETYAPLIKFQSAPGAISATSSPIIVNMSDPDSGLMEFRVEVFQRSSSYVMMTKVFEEPAIHNFSLEIPLVYDGGQVNEGPLRIVVTVWDRSRWKNHSQTYIDLNVDITPPEIKTVSEKIALEQGGAGLFFFQASDSGSLDSSVEVGVEVGDAVYKGFRAVLFDPTFIDFSDNVYFVLFSVPISLDSKKDSIKLFAQDLGGNTSHIPIPFNIAESSTQLTSIDISDEAVRAKARALGPASGIDVQIDADMSIDTARQILGQSLLLLSQSEGQAFANLGIRTSFYRTWHGQLDFTHPNAALIASFGDDIAWKSSDNPIGKTKSTGLLYKFPKEEVIKAPNAGVVVYVGDMRQLSKGVVIDCGLGLTISYSLLSETSVLTGSSVHNGLALGKVGAKEIGQDNELLVEMRLQGNLTNPAYWADKYWLDSHVNRVASEAKDKLKIRH